MTTSTKKRLTFDDVKDKLNMTTYELAVVASVSALVENQKKIKVLYSYETIKGEGYGHYYCPDTKLYVKVRKGRIVNRLSEDTDSKGRYLIYVEGQRILVPSEEITDIGYN
jgi:hypothetical protein